MSKFFAQPYDFCAEGFYFSDAETFEAKKANARNVYGQKVEEFEIQFIDGKLLDCQLAEAYDINQANIADYIEHEAQWDEWQKIKFILAVGVMGAEFEHSGCDPDHFDIAVYQLDSFKELAVEFVEEGLFGEIPGPLQYYVDYEAIARDLAVDHWKTNIEGKSYIFRMD